MTFCPNCGSQATGSFCPNCGTALSSSGPSSAAGSGFPSASVNASGLTDNVAGALCYSFGFITGIIFLLLAPYNRSSFVRFHAFQSIFLTIAWFAVTAAFGVLTAISHGLLALFFPLIYLAFFILWLYMMYTAFTNKKTKLPVIGDLAEKQA